MTKQIKTIFILFGLTINFVVFGQPSLKIDTDTIDVGTIIIKVDSVGRQQEYQTIRTSVRFKNIGNEPLMVLDHGGNGNVSVSYPKEPVLPGKTGIMNFILDRFLIAKYADKDYNEGWFFIPLTLRGNFKEDPRQIWFKGYRQNQK